MDDFIENIAAVIHDATQLAGDLKHALNMGYLTIDGVKNICDEIVKVLEEDQKS